MRNGLNLIKQNGESSMNALTEGYEIVNTPESQDALTFFQEEQDTAEEELEFLKEIDFFKLSLERIARKHFTVRLNADDTLSLTWSSSLYLFITIE